MLGMFLARQAGEGRRAGGRLNEEETRQERTATEGNKPKRQNRRTADRVQFSTDIYAVPIAIQRGTQ